MLGDSAADTMGNSLHRNLISMIPCQLATPHYFGIVNKNVVVIWRTKIFLNCFLHFSIKMNGLVSGYGSDSDGEDTEHVTFPNPTPVIDTQVAENELQNDGKFWHHFVLIEV